MKKPPALYHRLLLGVALAWPLLAGAAGLPQTLNYQGRMRLTSGAAVADSATHSISFALYSQPSLGTALWTENHVGNVATKDGLFNVILGSINPLTLPFDQTYWLGVNFNGNGEMSPRSELTMAPYAFRAQFADSASVAAPLSLTSPSGASAVHGANLSGGAGLHGTASFGAAPSAGLIGEADSNSSALGAFGRAAGTGQRYGLAGSLNPAHTINSFGAGVNAAAVAGWGHSGAEQGHGVYGRANGDSTVYGIYGQHLGGGTAVRADAPTGTGLLAMGQFAGVSASASGTSGSALYALSSGGAGAALRALASNVGVSATATGPGGIGVLAANTAVGGRALVVGGSAVFGPNSGPSSVSFSTHVDFSGANVTGLAPVTAPLSLTLNAAMPVAPIHGVNLGAGPGVFGDSAGAGPGVFGNSISVNGAGVFAQNLGGGHALVASGPSQMVASVGPADQVLFVSQTAGSNAGAGIFALNGASATAAIVGQSTDTSLPGPGNYPGRGVHGHGPVGVLSTTNLGDGIGLVATVSSTTGAGVAIMGLNEGQGTALQVRAMASAARAIHSYGNAYFDSGENLSSITFATHVHLGGPVTGLSLGVTAPLGLTSSTGSPALYALNNGGGRALEAANSAATPAIYAQNNFNTGVAIHGINATGSNNGTGVRGEIANGGSGSAGVLGNNTGSGYGVLGQSSGGVGVYGSTNMPGAHGVQGRQNNAGGTGAGVYGDAASATGYGVQAENSNGGVGLLAIGSPAIRVQGQIDANANRIVNLMNPTSLQDAATKDYVDQNLGAFVLKAGDTMTGSLVVDAVGTGIHGLNGATGVRGDGSTYGVYGSSPSSYGVFGQSGGSGTTIAGVSGANSSAGPGVHGNSNSGPGVLGTSTTGEGVRAESNNAASAGLRAIHFNTGYGVHGSSNNGIGVFGTGSSNHGVMGQTFANTFAGVMGTDNSATGGVGVWGNSGLAGGVAVRGRNIAAGGRALLVEGSAFFGPASGPASVTFATHVDFSGATVTGLGLGVSAPLSLTRSSGSMNDVALSAHNSVGGLAALFTNSGGGTAVSITAAAPGKALHVTWSGNQQGVFVENPVAGSTGYGVYTRVMGGAASSSAVYAWNSGDGAGVTGISGGNGAAVHAWQNGGLGPALYAQGTYIGISAVANAGGPAKALFASSNGPATPAAEIINTAGGSPLKINSLSFPANTGNAGQVLTTDGTSQMNWAYTPGPAAPLSLTHSGAESTLSLFNTASGGRGLFIQSNSGSLTPAAEILNASANNIGLRVVGGPSTGGIGVLGQGAVGVYGQNAGTATDAMWALAAGAASRGLVARGEAYGVSATATNTTSGVAVYGQVNTSGSAALLGVNSGIGGVGVHGINNTPGGWGVLADSTGGGLNSRALVARGGMVGVSATSNNNGGIGVYGGARTMGVLGETEIFNGNAYGVLGRFGNAATPPVSGGAGVAGLNDYVTGIGVYARATGTSGVAVVAMGGLVGLSATAGVNGTAVVARVNSGQPAASIINDGSGYAILASSVGDTGAIRATATDLATDEGVIVGADNSTGSGQAAAGVYGISGNNVGVMGFSGGSLGVGVRGGGTTAMLADGTQTGLSATATAAGGVAVDAFVNGAASSAVRARNAPTNSAGVHAGSALSVDGSVKLAQTVFNVADVTTGNWLLTANAPAARVRVSATSGTPYSVPFITVTCNQITQNSIIIINAVSGTLVTFGGVYIPTAGGSFTVQVNAGLGYNFVAGEGFNFWVINQ